MDKTKICTLLVGVILFMAIFSKKDTTLENLALQATLDNKLETVKFLLVNGVDVNTKYENNHTLLHNAALDGNLAMVKILVAHKAKLSKNEFGLNAIDSAKENKTDAVLNYLTQHFNEIENTSSNPHL